MAVYKKKKQGFTITEMVTALILLFFVASIVTTKVISNSKQKQSVEKIKYTYNLLEKATNAWQDENNCKDDIKICIQEAKSRGVSSSEMFNGIAKYLPVVASTVDVTAKGRNVKGEDLSTVDWLPDNTTTFLGKTQKSATTGVSKYYDMQNQEISYYMLRNGVTISVNMPDMNGNTGFGFFDIDGKDGANKVGIDVFPFSLGANISKDNPLYDDAAYKFSPYFASDNISLNADVCNIKSEICANKKIPSNPTAYVLYSNKLPNKNY